MAQAYISTAQPNLRLVSITNTSISDAYTSRTPTTTKPTVGVVLDYSLTQGYWNPSLIKVMPWGAKSDGTAWTTSAATTGFRLIGWQSYADASTGNTFWCPSILAAYSLLFASGAPAAAIGDTQYGSARFFGGGAAQLGGAPASFPTPNVYLPGGTTGGTITTPASFLVDIAGAQLVTVDFIRPAAETTANMGLLWYAI